MSDKVFCKDCKWYKWGIKSELDECYSRTQELVKYHHIRGKVVKQIPLDTCDKNLGCKCPDYERREGEDE